MIVDKVLELNSFKQKKWLEISISFKTQKSSQATNDLERSRRCFVGNIGFHRASFAKQLRST